LCSDKNSDNDMAKTKPYGVRFDKDLLDVLKEDHKIQTPQQAVNFLSAYYRDNSRTVDFEKKFGDFFSRMETSIQDLTKPNLEIKPKEAVKSNFGINTSKKPEKPANEEKTVSGEETKPIGDIEKQIQAIMNETKPANMSFPQWNTSRRKRIEALKNQEQ
jgi:hypothetical protein